MSNRIILKKSSVTSKAPATGDLEYGELALNYADGKLYYKTSTNTVQAFNIGPASGTVTNVDITSTDLTVSGNPITSSGTITLAINTVPISKGGTGQTTQQAALNALAGATTANRVLRGNGTNITLAQVDLTTDVTGTLPIANGGTGQTSFTSGYIRSNGTALSSTATIEAADIAGTATLTGLTVSGTTNLSNITNSTSTITGALIVSGGVGIGKDLHVGGSVYGNVIGNLTGNADTVSTIQSTTNATHFLTFVDANNTSATTETIYTNSGLNYNPSTGILTASEFSVTQGSNGSAALITTTTATNQVVDTVSANIYRTVKYVLQVSSGVSYQTSEILMIHDGTNAYLTEYATIKTSTSTLATFAATLNAGSFQLLVTPTNAITTVRAIRTAINI